MGIPVETPADLGPAAILAVADGAEIELSPRLMRRLAASRGDTVLALAENGPVYGVTTGLGSQAHLAVAAVDQPAFQDDLMLARSVGTGPWLGRREVRATLAARLRTLLEPEVGASGDLATALVAVLRADLHPAVPARGNGGAGEIIPLAHLGAFLTGRGEGVDASGDIRPALDLLRDAGLAPYSFAAKEGIAFLEGVPVAAAQAVLAGAATRLLAAQSLAATAAEVVVVRAPRDPYIATLARGDAELAAVHDALRALVGDEPTPRMPQAPVSFRVVGPALAHLLRARAQLDGAVERVLTGVSTSPALVEGRFLGTAGFDGFDLAASADGLRLAVLHLGEVAAARLHRMLDPRVTGLPSQLSAEPGRHAGLVALHKRVVGLLHEARRAAAPASLGATDTSLGQEDVQSFGLEATLAAYAALRVLRDITACELVVVHQATLLDRTGAHGSARLQALLHQAFETLPDSPEDRPTGRDVTALVQVLDGCWAHDVLGPTGDFPSHTPPIPS